MVIVADFVANHCHKSCSLFADGKHREWFCYKSNGKYKCFAGIEDLPMFNSKNKDVQQYLTQKALDLCDMGFDAIRLDHATAVRGVGVAHITSAVAVVHSRSVDRAN